MKTPDQLPSPLTVRASSVARKFLAAHARFTRLVLCAVLLSAGGAATASEEDRVLAAVDALFDAMRAKDAEALQSAFLPEGRLGTEDTEGWIRSVSTSEAYLDEVTFDETVLIDDSVAMAWTPYNLFVNGEFHHCGIDLFSFRKVDGQWKILQIDDTRREEPCDPKRRGNNR